jgi:hypothetical protein
LEIKGLLKKISGREKMLIIGALAVLIIFLIYQILFVPLLRSQDVYQQQRIELENLYSNYQVLTERYLSQKSYYDSFREQLQRKKSFSVLTYLENESQSAGIRDNIEYIRPKGSETNNGVTASSVEIKIDAISARDLLLFLSNIERNRNGLIVSYLRLKPFFKEKEKVDVIVRVTDIIVD